MALADLVSKAVDHLEAGGTENDEVIDDKEIPVVDEVEEEEEVPTEEEEMDEISLAEAKKLYKALKDPTQTVNVVTALAGQLGLLNGSKAPETKSEVKEAKKDVKDILKNALGTEYAFLSDRIGNALDEIFTQERNEAQSRIDTLSNSQIERDSLAAMQELARETKGESTKLEAKMVELAKVMMPGPNVTIKDYLHNLYTIASSGKQVGVIKKQVDDKIRRNANDVSSRLRSGGGNRNEEPFDPNKKYSLKESVAIAAKQLQAQGSKGK